MKKVVLALAVVILAGAAAFAWWLQDANRFKPAIEALIERETGRRASIAGNLAWQLWPPISITADSVTTRAGPGDAPETIAAERLELGMNVANALRNPDAWQIDSLQLTNVRYETPDLNVLAPTLVIEDFTPARPAPVAGRATVIRPGAPDMNVQLDARVTYTPASDTWRLNAQRLVIDQHEGTCDLTASKLDTPAKAASALISEVDGDGAGADTEPQLIPAAALLAWSINGTCQAPALTLAGETFVGVRIDIDANDGHLATTINAREFFGGRATLTTDIALTSEPLDWRLEPDLKNVDSTRLLAWLEQDLRWAAPLTLSGATTLTGNSVAALRDSVRGEFFFDGAQGVIDIAALKRPLAIISATLDNNDRVSRWPDEWQYQRFTGTWVVAGNSHRIAFVIDNLNVQGSGLHDWADDRLDMNLTLTVSDDPTFSSFDINPLLVDLAIPVRCRGKLDAVRCRLDEAGARDLVAKTLRGDANAPLRQKLEDTIEEKVPEEFRDAARALLDLLGGALDDG